MKKIIAIVLVIAVFASTVSIMVANDQIAVDSLNVNDVYFVLGENIVTGEPIITPTIDLSWEIPNQWAEADSNGYHDPDYYEVNVYNRTYNTETTLKVLSGSQEFVNQQIAMHDELSLKTGSFYEFNIQPFHYHTTAADGGESKDLASNVQNPQNAFAITDMNVEFQSSADSIKVIWDDLGIPEFEYRIVYALGDFTNSTKQQLINNAEGEIQELSIDDQLVEQFYDPIEQKNKLSYTLDDSIYPGQVYSVMVEPTVDYYNGRIIGRNRNYPLIRSVSTNIQLGLVEDGDYVRLQWEIPPSFKVGQDQDEYELVEATLMSYTNGKGSKVAIFDGDNATIGYYRLQKPRWETEYQIFLEYEAIVDGKRVRIDPAPESNKVTFVPSEYQIRPTKPYVPKLLTEEKVEELEGMDITIAGQELKDYYLVPGYNYSGPIGDIYDELVTFHVDKKYRGINLVWGSFWRRDLNYTSSTYEEEIPDTNVYYDIWVTDELATLSSATAVLRDQRYSSTTDPKVMLNSKEQIVGFKEVLTDYYNTEQKELVSITPDNLYFIKVQAKKVTSKGTYRSEPTIVSVYYSDDGDTFEPPLLAKPPLSVVEEETTTESVTIKWREKWYEIIGINLGADNLLSTWQHQVWVSKDTTKAPEFYSEYKAGTEYFPIYKGLTEVEKFKSYISGFVDAPNVTERKVSMGVDGDGNSNVSYRFYKLPYEFVLGQIALRDAVDDTTTYDFQDFYYDLVEGDRDGTGPIGWEDIDAVVDSDDATYLKYTEGELDPNTAYMFVIYPYRELADNTLIYAHYPTPIIVSTNPVETPISPDPTVPNLYAYNPTDMSIRVTWKYNEDFNYTLKYSVNENVDTAEVYEYEWPEDTTDPLYPKNGLYAEVLVEDLFPLTTYYFWLQAEKKDTQKTSAWSNPATERTLDTDTPIPPRGLGLPPVTRIEPHSYEQSVTEEYIIIEWIKDLEDVEVDESEENKRVNKAFTYVVELADNAKFIDPVYVESTGGGTDIVPSTVEVLEKNLVKFNELTPNRNYYIRAKTKVMVTGHLEGQLIEKESLSYTEPIRIITLSAGDEYDGDIDPALTILPERDYELVYDEDDDMLVFRFRDDDIDSEGNKDNSVDQRLISELIDQGIYEYEIDVDGFEGKEVDKRRVIIPYSVIEAFDTHQVDMEILADEMVLDLPSGAVIDYVKDQVNAFGVAPSVIIDIEELDVKHTTDLIPDGHLTSTGTPQRLGVTVKSPRKTDTIGYTDEDMSVGMKVNSRYEVYNKDAKVYIQDINANWTSEDGKLDKESGMMTFDTAKTGRYGLYVEDHKSSEVPTRDKNHWSEPYRQDVYEQITVSGLSNYNPQSSVSEKNVVQAVYGTAMDESRIDLSATMSGKDMTTIQRAGLKQNSGQSDGEISREEAIAMFVRAYEIRNESNVPVDGDTYNKVVGSGQVNDAYAEAMTKAYAIGVITDLDNIRGKTPMTFGEFFTVWSRALD